MLYSVKGSIFPVTEINYNPGYVKLASSTFRLSAASRASVFGSYLHHLSNDDISAGLSRSILVYLKPVPVTSPALS